MQPTVKSKSTTWGAYNLPRMEFCTSGTPAIAVIAEHTSFFRTITVYAADTHDHVAMLVEYDTTDEHGQPVTYRRLQFVIGQEHAVNAMSDELGGHYTPPASVPLAVFPVEKVNP